MANTQGDDPYNLARFTDAQFSVYGAALAEIKRGRKTSHWMWFIFPQAAGLGYSAMAQRYAVGSLDEAQAYLAHPVLGARLQECAEALLGVDGRTASAIFGSPDDRKLQSSMTLFSRAEDGQDSVYARVLDKYYGGAEDEATLELLERV